MKIGNFEIEKPIMLAPMAGVTDVGFRTVCSQFGADATVTEMLSARAMMHNPSKTEFMTLTSQDEKVKLAQIFGHEVEFMKAAVQSDMLAKFDGFDINMGCPAPKIVKNGEGAALMDNPKLAYEIISAVKSVTDKPVSVKFRKGHLKENFLEFARMCEDAGANFVTFHARTVAQGYSGHADWDALATVKAKLNISVVGNGDVVDEKSLAEILQTGVDGVMIGRGALGQPWLFSQLKNSSVLQKSNKKQQNDVFLQNNNQLSYLQNLQISPEIKFAALEKHIQILRDHFSEKWLTKYIRKHLLWYAGHLPNTAILRTTLATCEDVNKCLLLLKDSFYL